MLRRLADLSARRPRRVLLATLAFFLVAVALGGPVAGRLSGGDDFFDPDSESHRAEQRLRRAAGEEARPAVIALVRTGQVVTRPAARARVERIARELRRDPAVSRVVTFYHTRDRPFVSRDRTATFVAAFFRADAGEDAGERIAERFENRPGVAVGGAELAEPAIGDQVGEDLAKAELIAFPILFLLSLWVFRGVVAALLPIFVGVLTIFGTFLGLRLVNEATLLSIFALNLATGLGLGLAIDYSLFVVSRYREELARSGPGVEALRRTLASAGRTVLFSALTVAAALAALTVFPQRFLYSMGLSGTISALVAAAVSLTALPALLALLGPRVNALAPARWQRARDREARAEAGGFWYRLSRAVMRRPLPVAVASAALLIAIGLPFTGIKFTGVDASVLPASSGPRQVDDALRREFPPAPSDPIALAVEAPPDARPRLERYAEGLRRLPEAASVAPPRRLDARTWMVEVTPRRAALDERSLDLVREIRDRPAPFPVQAAGQSAEFVDQQDSLAAHLPLGLAVLAVATMLILFAMTGSVVLPLKSLVMNLLTLSAAFGLLVLIFQHGRLEGLLDYTSQGALESTQPILLFAIAFALSTDYGVFLLTRIKEARDAGAEDHDAVAIGLERTGRIVTAAALLFCVAIGAFATSEIVFIKEVGVGTALAVIIDATIIRALLVPSLMALLGRRNWWAPRPLRRLHERVGLSEA